MQTNQNQAVAAGRRAVVLQVLGNTTNSPNLSPSVAIPDNAARVSMSRARYVIEFVGAECALIGIFSTVHIQDKNNKSKQEE